MKKWMVGVVAGLGGILVGWLVTLIAFRDTGSFETPAFQESVAWQGWIGAVFGGVAALGGAVLVLLWQRRIDDARQAAQKESDKEAYEDQRTADRELAREQRLVAAWSSFCAALTAVPSARNSFGVEEEMERATASYWTWSLNLRVSELRASRLVGTALRQVGESALVKWETNIATVQALLEFGAEWHRVDGDRVAAERGLVLVITPPSPSQPGTPE